MLELMTPMAAASRRHSVRVGAARRDVCASALAPANHRRGMASETSYIIKTKNGATACESCSRINTRDMVVDEW